MLNLRSRRVRMVLAELMGESLLFLLYPGVIRGIGKKQEYGRIIIQLSQRWDAPENRQDDH